MRLARRLEAWLEDTPLEGFARWAWSHLRSIGHPRVRQSMRYDAQSRRIMRRILREDSNCVDAGAHRGEFLEEMLALAPKGHHLAFEPLPHLARRLSDRFPAVDVRQIALSDRAGTRPFHWVVNDPGLSGFRVMGHVDAHAPINRIEAETGSLDEILPPDLPIRFIKIDVEGAQYEVLRGGVKTIARDRPYIIFEHGALARDSYGTNSEMIHDLLVRDCGLRISLLDDWLSGAEPLTVDEFAAHVGHHSTSHFCFLAHPPSSDAPVR